jgi:kinesin family protein 5
MAGPDGPNREENPVEESIQVCCRFRPQNQQERASNGKISLEVPDNTTVLVPNSDHTFVFDHVFRWDASQKEVYDYAAKPIINAVLRGFNGTVFAYGQTASGKTYTMEGPDIEDKFYQGVIPRMVWSIFDGIYNADEHIEFLVKVSIVEIYNERIRDLLDPKKDSLKVHEDKARGVFIGEVTESYVGCEQEIFDAMRAGHFNRSMAVTNMNEHSSRSHLVFMLTIEQKNLHDRSRKVGKLHLVDLAGSEKVAKTGASGERLDEAKNINRSLSALGNVINALTDKKYTHVPYRDSKLTRVLQESLGGNAKTSLIITCSPSNYNEQETISTLRFGQRAKKIKNVVKVNHERSAEELKLLLEKRDFALAELRARVAMLEQLLRSHNIEIPDNMAGGSGYVQGGGDRVDSNSPAVAELVDQLQDKRAELKDAAERISELNREREEMQRQMRASEEEKQRLQSRIMDITNEREKIEYERNEKADEAEKLSEKNAGLLHEMEELRKVVPNGNPFGSLMGEGGRESTGGDGEHSRGADARDAELERLKDVDRPLKRKVSQLDKNLEQLTVMYHKLVAQNSGLKVEVSENDKKIQRKDQRISQLERNLREAKQKYEKLLTQCANLTAAMDVMGRSKASAGFSSGNSSNAVRRSPNIVRPVRGGSAYGVGEPVMAPYTPSEQGPESPSLGIREVSRQSLGGAERGSLTGLPPGHQQLPLRGSLS